MPEEAVMDAPQVTEVPDGGSETETPELETPVEEPVEDAEQPTETPAEEPAEEEPVEGQHTTTPDGRKLPDDVKKALASLKAANPTVAGKLRDVWFQEQRYREVFPKPEEAVAAKEFIEQLGGQDGLKQIEAEREEWTALDRAYAEAPADFVKTIAESNPNAFLKVAPQAINEWASRAPEQYGYFANQVALNTMKNAGISLDVLARAHAAYADNPQAQSVIADIHDRLLNLQQQSAQFEQKRHDPREAELNQREQKFEQQRRASFEEGVAGQAQTYLQSKMQPEIDRVLSGRKADPEANARHVKLVEAEIGRRLAEIPGFADKLEAFYRTGDAKSALTYIQTQYDRILPAAVKSEIAPLYRNFAAPKTATAPSPNGKPTQPASPGTVVLKEMPDNKDIDWSKCTVADVIQGHAILTNGKKATGWA